MSKSKCILLILVSISFITSSLVLILWHLSYKNEGKKYEELNNIYEEYKFEITEEVGTEKSNIPLNPLLRINEDYVGWITVKDTKIDYPIVYCSEDNTTYLTKNFYKENSDFGCIFLNGYNNSNFSDDISILFGHRMKDGSMFAGIKYFSDKKYLKDHNLITLETLEKSYKYIIIKYIDVSVNNKLYSQDANSLKSILGKDYQIGVNT